MFMDVENVLLDFTEREMKLDHLAFIGRFEPFHLGHLEACQAALTLANHLILLVGSALAAPDIRNPFSFHQREMMMRMVLDANGLQGKYTILPLRDFHNNDNLWIAEVQKLVNAVTSPGDTIALFGHNKDSTSYYLKLFPSWGDAVEHKPQLIMNASDARREIILNGLRPTMLDMLPPQVQTFLDKNFYGSKEYERLQAEYNQVIADRQKYGTWNEKKKEWELHTAVCTDAIVTCLGHVLLVIRKGKVGYGLKAWPGGHLEKGERIKDGCIRELLEETRIKVPKPVLYGSITKEKVFDHPLRSVVGRKISHGFFIELKDTELPKVRGADDAQKAFWLPLNEAYNNPRSFFEDHYSILEYFVGNASVEARDLVKPT